MSDLVPKRGGAVAARSTISSDAAEELMRAWLSDKAEVSLNNYKYDLSDFAAFREASDVPAAIAELLGGDHGTANRIALAYRADLLSRPRWTSPQARSDGAAPTKTGFASATVNRRLAALRSICKLARRFGHIDWALEVDSVEHEGVRDTDGVDREDYLQLLGYLEAEAAAAGADDDPPGQARALRDLCILRFLMDHALRRAEVISLTWPEDVDMRGSWLWILGKKRREKEKFPLSAGSKAALKAWLALRGREVGPLFFSFSNKARRARLSKRGFNDLVAAAAARAGLGHLRPHMFRHAAITRALDKTNGDVRAVARFSRHKKIDTVMVYDDRRRQKPREIVDLVAEEDDDDE